MRLKLHSWMPIVLG